MKKLERISAGIAIVVFAVSLSQCSKKNQDASVSPQPKPAAKMVSLRADANQGNYLVDSYGHALYFFANDAGKIIALGDVHWRGRRSQAMIFMPTNSAQDWICRISAALPPRREPCS